jgi:DNA segregation ATPase FtsK/SpoIIIE, S-DNA-T family
MADKDDLFPEEDGTDPQDPDATDSASDEDDDIIDLLDSVDTPDDAKDVIELSDADIVDTADAEVIDLTEAVEAEDVLELTEKVDASDAEEEIFELKDTVSMDALDPEDDDIVELTEEVEPGGADQEIFELKDTVSMDALDPEDDDIVELTDEARVSDDEIVELTEPVDEAEITPRDETFVPTDFEDTIAMEGGAVSDIAQEEDLPDGEDEIVEPVEALDEAEITPRDETFTPTDFEDTMALDSELVRQAETDQADVPIKEFEEDKELLELIDDIQATLDEEPEAVDSDLEEGLSETEEAIETDIIQEEEVEPYELIDDDTIFAEQELADSETELFDNLGIDLTSEIERKALKEVQEAAIEEVQPPEAMEGLTETDSVKTDSVETAVKHAISDMLSDEDNPLVKAIEKAVKKALGQ